MASLSDRGQTKIIDNLLRGVSWTPTVLYAALSKADPLGNMSAFNEVTGGGYQRIEVTCNTSNWARPSSTNGVATLTTALTWEADGADFGTITHVVFFEAATGTSQSVFYDALPIARTINDGETITYAANAGIVVTAAGH